MARPMLLMQEEMLSILWRKQVLGVPVSTLIQQEDLDITPPTLTKLLKHIGLLEQEEMKDNELVYLIIYNSLFPKWLIDNEDIIIMKQPLGWFYNGHFPLGKWEQENK